MNVKPWRTLSSLLVLIAITGSGLVEAAEISTETLTLPTRSRVRKTGRQKNGQNYLKIVLTPLFICFLLSSATYANPLGTQCQRILTNRQT